MLWVADSVSWLEKVMPEADSETVVKTVLFSDEEQDESRKRIQKKPGMTAFGIYGNFCEAKADVRKFNGHEHYFPSFSIQLIFGQMQRYCVDLSKYKI